MQEVSKRNAAISAGGWGGETETMQFMEFRRGNSLAALITHHKYLQGNDINEGSKLFTVSDDGRAGGSDLDLRKGSLGVRKPGWQEQPGVGCLPFCAESVCNASLARPTSTPVVRPACGLCGSSQSRSLLTWREYVNFPACDACCSPRAAPEQANNSAACKSKPWLSGPTQHGNGWRPVWHL